MFRKRSGVLVIADPASIWTAKYIEHVLMPRRARVFLTFSKLNERLAVSPFRDFYEAAGVVIVTDAPAKVLAKFSKVPKVRVIAKSLSHYLRVLARSDYRAVHVLGVSLSSARMGALLAFLGKPLVTSFWGSDLLRRDAERLRAMRPLLVRSRAITVGNRKMLRVLRGLLGHSTRVRLNVVHFGIEGFDAIEKVSHNESRSTSRAALGVPSNQPVLVVGYNARPAQQHLRTLQALSSLEPEIRENVHLVLPLSYSVEDQGYLEEVMATASRSFPSRTLIRHYLSIEDQARLCLTADLFINAQTTDMFSASMQEFLFAGAVMVKGAWLNYPELDQAGVGYEVFEYFDELPMLVRSLLSKEHIDQAGSSNRKEALKALSSWQSVADSWWSLYGFESVSDPANVGR